MSKAPSGSSTQLEDLNEDVERVPETPSGSSTELESDYETDPDCPEGVIPQTQPCMKNGISYVPYGLRKVYQKKRKPSSAIPDERR